MTREMRFWISLLTCGDFFAILCAWGAAYWLRFRSGWIRLPEGNVVHPLEIYAVPALFSLFIFAWALGRRRSLQPRDWGWWEDAGTVLQSHILAGPLLVALTYLVYRDRYSRLVLGLFLLFSPVLILGTRGLVRAIIRHGFRRGIGRRRLLAVCGAAPADRMLKEYLEWHPGAELVEVLNLQHLDREALTRKQPDEILMIYPPAQAAEMGAVLKELENEPVDIKLIPDWGEFRLLGYDVERAGSLPVIHLRRSPLHGWGGVVKRLLDILLSLIVLISISPLLVLIALVIRLTAGSPVLYSQPRMGYDGRLFCMYKFRSMQSGSDGEGNPPWTRPGDPRRTRVGAWLRRFNLDELPQLLNILRGDMSFVGPRPEMAHLIQNFRQQIPHYALRFKARAGLTGWAQIHGLRGNTSLEERIDYDLYYIENWSLGLDLKILLLTIFRGWTNAY